MADEKAPIRGTDAAEFAEAAARVARGARTVEAVAGKTRNVAEGAEEAGRRLRLAADKIERSLRVQPTGAGRFYVEQDTGNRSGGTRYEYAMREGRQRPSYFATREAAEREKQAIVYQRAVAAEAEATRQAEAAKTAAVRQGTARRRAIRTDFRVQTGEATTGVTIRSNVPVAPAVREILSRRGTAAVGELLEREVAANRFRGGAYVDRGGQVFGLNEPRRRGRPDLSDATPLGSVGRRRSMWTATGLDEAELGKFKTRSKAVDALVSRSAAVVEQAEQRKTTAAERGALRRKAAMEAENRAIAGNADEFERVAAARAEDARRELETHRAYQERVKAGTAPEVGSPEFERQAAEQRAQADAIERARATAPTPVAVNAEAAKAAETEAALGKGAQEVKTEAAQAGAEKRLHIEEESLGHASKAAATEISLGEGAQKGMTSAAARESANRLDIENASLNASARAAATEVSLAQQAEAAKTEAARQGAEARSGIEKAAEAGGKEKAAKAPRTPEEEAAAADRRVARQRERAEADKAARVRARETRAAEAAAQQKLDDVERGRQAGRLHTGLTNLLARRELEEARLSASRPGTDIIPHPTEFGRRVPGPFGGLGGAGDVVGEGSGVVSRQFTINRNRIGRQERTAVRRDAAAVAEQRALDEQARTMDEARAKAASLGAEEGRLARQLEKTSIAADLSSQRFRKHGALTTEFIEAAAKGQVTMRELGYQITATIGKFAGWTAAATAVYAVAGAMTQLGRGAIDSASGVERTHRVIDEVGRPGGAQRVQEGFRDLSERFNVPIADTVDATYGAGKVFGDLDGALKGAAVSLFAMKVGELDAAQATESLAAIVRGFKLDADELPGVFDNINEAQNRFGGNVGQLTQGVGRAAGQFRSAGGNTRELIALLTAGARLTGAPATEIATAIGRSVSVVRTPAGAARARAAGLDPTLDPLALIQQAQQLAQGASPERVQEIARAIIPSGGQFARIFVPLIENAELLNKVLAATTPEKTKGSAQRELAKALREPVEQISALVNGLQRLGAVAAETGFLTPFVALLKLLNTAINATENLLGLFNTVVPNPLQPVLATALELYGVMRLLRRFDVGGQLPAEAPRGVRNFFGQSPDRRERTQVLQGLTAQDRFLRNTRERVGQEAALAAFRQDQAAKRFRAAAATGDDALILRRQADYDRAALRAADLAEEEADLRTQINQTDARRNVFTRRIKEGATVAQASAAADITYRTAGVARPTTRGPQRIDGRLEESPGGVILPAGAGRAAQGVDRATRGLAATEAEMTRTQRAAARFRERSRAAGVSGRALGASAVAAADTAAAVRGGMQAASAGMARVGTALVSLIGPLDLAILGVLGVFEINRRIKENAAKQEAKLKDVRKARSTGDPVTIRRSVEDLPETTPISPSYMYTYPGQVPGGELGEARRASEATASRLEAAQARGRQMTVRQVDEQLSTARAVAASSGEQRAAIRTAITQLEHGFALTASTAELGGAKRADKIREAARQRITALTLRLTALGSLVSDVDKALRDAQDLEALGTIVEGQGALIELRGGEHSGRARDAIGKAFLRASEIYGRDQDPAAYLKALREQEETILAPAEARLERLLAETRAPAGRTRARRQYLRTVKRGFGLADDQGELRLDAIEVATQRREERLRELEAERERLAGAGSTDPLTGARVGLPGSGNRAEITNIDAEIRALKERIATSARDKRAIEEGIKYREHRLEEIRHEIAQQEFSEATELFGARTNLLAGRTAAGLPRIALQIRRQGQVVRRLVASKFASQTQIVDELQKQDALLAQQVQAQADLILTRANLQTGGAPGAGLNELLKFQRAHPEVYGENEIGQTLIQIRDAGKQAAEEASQKARDLIASRYEVLRSLTDNPVEIAKLEAEEAQKILNRGGFESQAERNRAIANRNNTRRSYEQSIADRRLENAEYAHDIGKLSDQAYIHRLEQIQRTYEKGTEGYRRLKMQIGRFKHDLSDATELELTPGDVKLPTLTEIRKFIGGKTLRSQEPQVIGSHQQITNRNTVVLNIAKGSEGKVYEVLEQAGIRGVKTAARSRRLG